MLKRWHLVWEHNGAVEIRFTYRWMARLAAWDVNRHRARNGKTTRVVVVDSLGDTGSG